MTPASESHPRLHGENDMPEGAVASNARRERAVVLVAHGAADSPTAGTSLRRLAGELRRRCADTTVAVAHIHGEPTLPSVLDALDVEDSVWIVPMFAAEGHHTRARLPAALDDARARRPAQAIRQTAALGTLPAYTRSLARRLRKLVAATAIDARTAALVAIGHGRRGATTPPDDAARRLADALRPDFAESLALYLDGEPSAAAWATRTTSTDVVVVPVFFSDAHHASLDVPRIFGRPATHPAPADGIDGPWPCAGRRIWSVALPPASICVADIVLDLVREEVPRADIAPRRALAATGTRA